ncbi:hypothetical protein Emag_007810 [Eimeria magna]
MAATCRTVRALTSAQRQRRIVARATPPRLKRSRPASTASVTRDAAGLPPRMRAWRALLTTAAEPATLRRSSSPAPVQSRPWGLRRSPAGLPPAPPALSCGPRALTRPADLTQWRRGVFDRLPRLDTVPRNYADLHAFLQAVERAVQALDRPADAFHITMQQLHPRLQAHIRTCMTAQPDPTRTPYEHMVAILIQQVAAGKPEDYLHQTIALIAPILKSRDSTCNSRRHMTHTVICVHDSAHPRTWVSTSLSPPSLATSRKTSPS